MSRATPGTPEIDEYATVDEILADETDLPEKDITGVFGGKKLRIRALSAAQRARITQASLDQRGRAPQMRFGELERMQFQLGVIKPEFGPDQVRSLHLKSGPSFKKVVEEIVKLTGIDDESLQEAEDDFRERSE